MKVCQNCGGDEDVQHLSWDMDLPTLTLCRTCAVFIQSAPEEFDKRSKRKKKS